MNLDKNKLSGRFRQADKEALVTLALYVFFFLWWAFFAFYEGLGDPQEYTFILGMPSWFFLSCIVGYPVIVFLLWLAIRYFFVDMPLDDNMTEETA